MRGKSYLAAHRGNEAAADFQKNPTIGKMW
jgi:hypothetical protein